MIVAVALIALVLGSIGGGVTIALFAVGAIKDAETEGYLRGHCDGERAATR